MKDPPPGLRACIVVPEGDHEMTMVWVWDTPGQRGDWAAEVMVPLFESGELAEVTTNPAPVEPIDLFLRGMRD
ncbi:MAG: hypothetical protein ACR2OH_05125 [Microthrixaceae bacterium]